MMRALKREPRNFSIYSIQNTKRPTSSFDVLIIQFASKLMGIRLFRFSPFNIRNKYGRAIWNASIMGLGKQFLHNGLGDEMADIFMKINGISGEAKDAVHQGEIEISSWQWEMAQKSSMMSGSGGGAGKATINDLKFVHQIDRSSPNLMRYCLTGRHIPEAILSVRKAGGVPLDFLKITMGDVIITSVKPIVHDESYYEHVTLSFSRVKQEYTLQSDIGASAGTVTASFDIKENLDR